MEWRVGLTGDEHDLNMLAKTFRTDDLMIAYEQGRGYYISRSAWNQLGEAASVRERAITLVKQLSGAARLKLGIERPLKCGGVTEIRPDGSRGVVVFAEGAVFKFRGGFASFVVTRADGSIEEHHQADPLRDWLAAVSGSVAVGKVLRLLDDSDLDWPDLYRVYEVIEADMGGRRGLTAAGWLTTTQIRCFKHSANSPTAAGDDARHGIEQAAPPIAPMTRTEAEQLVKLLAESWLGYRSPARGDA